MVFVLSVLLPDEKHPPSIGAQMVLESLPFGHDADQTQLPCSPGSLINSDVAHQTLAKLLVHETHAATEARGQNNWEFSLMRDDTYNLSFTPGIQ